MDSNCNYEEVEELKQGGVGNSNFLVGSKIPSIGCFITILQFMGPRKQVRYIVKGLNKSKGKLFYLAHIKTSTEFSD